MWKHKPLDFGVQDISNRLSWEFYLNRIFKWLLLLLSVPTLPALTAVSQAWPGLGQLRSEPGGSPWDPPHRSRQWFEDRVWGDWTCHMHCKNTTIHNPLMGCWNTLLTHYFTVMTSESCRWTCLFSVTGWSMDQHWQSLWEREEQWSRLLPGAHGFQGGYC